jgi:hypothetical protein
MHDGLECKLERADRIWRWNSRRKMLAAAEHSLLRPVMPVLQKKQEIRRNRQTAIL